MAAIHVAGVRCDPCGAMQRSFNMYFVINKCVTTVKVSNFSGHYLRNRSTLDIGVLGYIGVVQHKEHSPEILSIPPGTPCISCFVFELRIVCDHCGQNYKMNTVSFYTGFVSMYYSNVHREESTKWA